MSIFGGGSGGGGGLMGDPMSLYYALNGVAQAMTQAGHGKPVDLRQNNAMLMQHMQQRQAKEKLGGLMDGLNLDPQQRSVLDALPVPMQQQILAQKAFPQGQDPTSGMREYEFYRQQAEASGQQPLSFMDYQIAKRKAGGTNINVNTGENMPQVGTIPQGYQLQQTPQGAWQMAPIPGGPAAEEAAQAERKTTEQQALAGRAGGVVLEDIGRVKKKVEESSLPVTGLVGSLLKNIPGTNAFDASALVKTIRGNIGFDRLQQMREASPTGGALGQVSNLELGTLQSVLGNLEVEQSEEQFLHNLDRLEQIYTNIMTKAAAYPNAQEYGFGGAPQEVQTPAQAPPAPEAERTLGGKRYIKINGEWYEAQ